MIRKLASVFVLLIPALTLAEVVEPDALYSDESSIENFYGDEDDYEKRKIHGFTFYVQLDILESKKKKAEAAYSAITSQLYLMKFLFPVRVMEKLEAENIKIVINDDCGDDQCETSTSPCPHACYVSYSSRLDEFYSKAIVFRNLEDLLKDFPQLATVLIHQFAHAFHNLIIPDGFDDQSIIDAWQEAVDSGKFEHVNYISDDDSKESVNQQHNLLKNEMEYFAEISEALWLRSEYEPFVYHQVFVDDVLTNQSKIQNLVENAWWDHSGPHPRRRWYWQNLTEDEEEDSSVNNNVPNIRSLFDLDYE